MVKIFYFSPQRSVLFQLPLFFCFFFLNDKNKRLPNPAAPVLSEQKTLRETIKDLITPTEGEKAIPVSKELIKSLTSSVVTDNNPAGGGSEKDKSAQSTPIPVSKDLIKSLTIPAVK